MSRKDFLNTKFSDSDNRFNLLIPIQPNHKAFFEEIAAKFRPAMKLSDDIRELVTRKDFNLCVDKTVIIFYKGDGYKLNTLKFYLFLNFIANWKPYEQYISSLVPAKIVLEDDSRLVIDSASLAEISELRFRDEPDAKQRLSYLYNRVDILFLTISYGNKLFDGDFFKELFRVVIDIRANQGLITVLIFPGTEKQFKDRGYEQYFYDMCVKRYNLTNSEINVNSNEKKSQKIIKSNSKKRVFSEEEDF